MFIQNEFMNVVKVQLKAAPLIALLLSISLGVVIDKIKIQLSLIVNFWLFISQLLSQSFLTLTNQSII